MSQFQPPPGPPGAEPPPFGSYEQADPHIPPRWSGSAIAGFVLSFLGCTGIAAVLACVFGVVGIVATRGGRRRGKGLAIAAIPISLVTVSLSFLIVISVLWMGKAVVMCRHLPDTWDADSVRQIASDDFRQTVTEEELQTWLNTITAKHGTLVEVLDIQPVRTARLQDGLPFDLAAKFVNGRANLRIVFSKVGLRHAKIKDIAVDGSSPRDSD